jgi:putative membrane protein
VSATAPDSPTDATRRTRLANERTYLAWVRTGITCLAAGLAVGRALPELTDGEVWPYALIGAGYVVAGMVLVLFGLVRERQVEDALDRGEFPRISNRALVGFTAGSIALGAGTLALVVFQV